MDAAELSKISADSHIDEPHDLWFERMDADLRDRAPRRIQAEQDGGWSLVVDDNPVGLVRTCRPRRRETKEEERIAAAAPDVRLEMMRTDGVNAEIIYPTIGLYVWNIAGPDGRTRGVPSSTTTGSSNGSVGIERIRLAAMIPTWDVDMAIDEVRRVARNDSVGGLLLPLVGHAGMEPSGVGTAVGRDPGDRHPRGDAPGHRPRHDLLPRLGLGHRQPPRHAVDGAARRRAA